MSDLAPGTEFAGCRIDGVAGRGGMGVVYSATDLRLQRKVALKLIAGVHAADAEFRDRFERESRLAAAIDHPNVVPIYGAGEQDGRPYLVMRLVRGTDLQQEVAQGGRLPVARVVAIISQVAAALDAAHTAGLVHRDVKPANVLLDGDHVYLTDFGLTRLAGSDTQITETGRWMGTVDFASPEQLQARRTDARSDVYALACVLYAALTGRPPFARDTVPAAIYAHLHDPVPRPSNHGAPAAFDRVLERALAKDPADRYPSAGDLGRAVLAAAVGERVTEEERTVATGSAAPQPDAETVVLNRRPAPAAPTVLQAPDAVPPAPPAPPRGVKRWVVVVLACLSFAGLVVVGARAVAGAGGGEPLPAVETVTEGEVRDVVDRFAAAYTTEDVGALRDLVAQDAVRVLPGAAGRQTGRRAVVAQYAQQFEEMRIRDYAVSDLEVEGGDAGRAEGAYRVRRGGGAPFGGGFVFGVVKEYGELRIRLLVATPSA